MKKLIYNQENIYPKQYLYYPNGKPKAELIHILSRKDCPRCYEKDRMNFTYGNKVYKRITE